MTDRGRKFDFERIMLLFNVGEKARGHGPAYSNIVAAADAELREINSGQTRQEREGERPRVITPPAGPASSMIENPDGTREAIQDPQLGQADRPQGLDRGYDETADLRGVQQPMPQTNRRETVQQDRPRAIPSDQAVHGEPVSPNEQRAPEEPIERKV